MAGLTVAQTLRLDLLGSEKFCIYEDVDNGSQLSINARSMSSADGSLIGLIVVAPSKNVLHELSYEVEHSYDAVVNEDGLLVW